MESKQEGAFQKTCSSCFQRISHILLPWKSLCFNCQCLFHAGTKIIRLDSHSVNTMRINRFSSGNPAPCSFLRAPFPQTILLAFRQGAGGPKSVGTVRNLAPVPACLGSQGIEWRLPEDLPCSTGWSCRREEQGPGKSGTSGRSFMFIYSILVEPLWERLRTLESVCVSNFFNTKQGFPLE